MADADWKLNFDRDTRKERVSLLRRVAHAAAVANKHLTDDEKSFSFVLRRAYEAKIINVADLGRIGHSDPTTASRWLNDQTKPNLLAQEAILKKIAELAENQANDIMSQRDISSKRERKRAS